MKKLGSLPRPYSFVNKKINQIRSQNLAPADREL